ncbi:hypothetical protein, partial [Paenibacillus thermoaerophilus]|uniref:hypothetical protein n=1 Tax=Paenibacillus thermoaerophilus TaxID=1215385 RepID=UPI001B886241
PAKSGKNAPKLTWKPIIRESSPSQPSQQPETIFENRLFQEQLVKITQAMNRFVWAIRKRTVPFLCGK